MTREEAQQHFWQTCAREMCRQALQMTDQYYRQHKDRLADEFAQVFSEFCRKIRRFQNSGRKGKIGTICCSMLYTALMQEQPAWRLDAYDDNYYFDEQECAAYFNTPWLYTPLYETCRHLQQMSKKYAGKINPGYIDSIKRRQAFKYIPYPVLVARQGLKQAVQSPEFAAIDKEETVNIRLGEYHDISEVIYCYDVSRKNNAEIRKWLEKKHDDYFCRVLTDLDLSSGDYSGITLSYSRLTKSILRQVNLQDTVLYGTDFSLCVIEDSNFSASLLHGAIFDGAVISRTTLEDSYASQTDLHDEDSEDQMLIDILAGASFCGSRLTEVNLSYCDLDNTDFTGATLNSVSFRYSSAAGINFQDAVLTGCDFRGTDLRDAQFQNTIITNCQFEGAYLENTCFSAGIDLDNTGLNDEQKAEVTVS